MKRDWITRASACVCVVLLVLLATHAHAEVIPATPVQESQAPGGFWQYAGSICGVASDSGFIFTSAGAAVAGVPQSLANSAAQSQMGACGNASATAGALTYGGTSTGGYALGDVLWNGSVVYTARQLVLIQQGGTGCPSGWTLNAGTCQRTAYTCPSEGGWSRVGTSCTRPEPLQCPAGQRPGYLGVACVPDNECQNRALSTGPRTVSVGAPSMICETGCLLRAAVVRRGPTGETYFEPPYVLVQEGCTVNGIPAPVGASSPTLAAGTCPGTVNGAAVVVPCASTGTQVTTNTQSSATSASGVTSSTGTTSTVTTTMCPPGGGACTTSTSTVVTNPDGSVTSTRGTSTGNGTGNTGTGTGSGGGGEGSSFGGACADTVCTGDAIFCAIAREQARRACELLGDGGARTQELFTVGSNAANGELTPEGHPGRNPESIDLGLSGRIDQTPLFGSSGSCPQDVPVPVAALRGVVWIRFSLMCPWLHLIGQCMVVLSMLVAARIVFKGF